MSTTSYASVVAALRDVHDEASLWHLSDELASVIPSGVDFRPVIAAAQAAAVPVRSVNTLRLYRDVATRFPAAQRVTGVSFSAHREALTISDNSQDASDLLHDLVKHHGSGVTVTTVRKAVQAATGKGASSAAGVGKAGAAVKLTWLQVAEDMVGGGTGLLGQLDVLTSTASSVVTLDTIHAGLSKLLGTVEDRRVKAAKKAARAKITASNAPASPKAAPKKAAGKVGGKAGDLRDL